MSNVTYSDDIKNKIGSFWGDWYRSVGLTKDVKKRVELRLEEEIIEAERIKKLESTLNVIFTAGQKHLVVGTGTGGLAVALFNKGCDVYGIEPNCQANNIVRLKAIACGMPIDNFSTHKAENMPFSNNTFDVIHCFTVLEHVDNVKIALKEMVRVLKPGGFIYINSPDYRFPYERHYKIIFPNFLPKLMGYLYLMMRGRPWKFFKHIKKINEKNINRILYHEPVTWHRVYRALPKSWDSCRPRLFLWKLFILGLNIPMNQEIIIRKDKAFL